MTEIEKSLLKFLILVLLVVTFVVLVAPKDSSKDQFVAECKKRGGTVIINQERLPGCIMWNNTRKKP